MRRREARIGNTLYILRKNKSVTFGFALVLLVTVLAIFAPLIAPYPEDSGKKSNLSAALESPSTSHLFGTDNIGRDVLSRVVFGARISLQIGVTVVGLSLIIGVLLGLVAGYAGGWTEMLIMRITDTFISIPRLILPVAISGVLPPSIQSAMLALIITWWPWYVRLLVSEVKPIKEKEYIAAAKALGMKRFRILFRHILPNSMTSLLTQATLDIGWAIMWASTLSFIGIGAQPPSPEWGLMVAMGRTYMPDFWWWSTFPGLLIFITVVGFNMAGDGIRDILDPRTRTRL